MEMLVTFPGAFQEVRQGEPEDVWDRQGGQDGGGAVSDVLIELQYNWFPLLKPKYFFERQEEDASEIASIARQAYDAAEDAYKMARWKD